MQSKPKRKGLITLLVLLALLVFVWLKHNAIYDWFQLRNYSAPAQVVQLATDTTMTSQTTHLFYVNHPAIESSSDFNASCPNNGGEQTIILGCYHNPQRGIFLFSVSDPQLNGVMQVTAAHETLHAIYDRLSTKERNYVDGLLQDYYQHDLHDQRLLDTIAAYKKSEPKDVVNEMHSVFGTEVSNLPPALETYYAQYFTNRAKIVSYSQQYQAAFSSRKAQADNLLQQIKALEQQLSTLKAQIDSQESDLRAKRQAIDSERGNITDVQAFNAQVDDYNSQVTLYQAKVATYNQLVNQHNQLRDQYQAIAVEETQLFKELDSQSSTVSSQ
ncbi:MAG TPA: hypothetical protein VLF90_03185 [Patescibacteria group bacterium]|nr:hypothetical protein [Patescibacteria group bacterium]